MGSLEEEELVKMVQDFIESESSSPMFPSLSNHQLSSFNHLTQHSVLQEILESETEIEKKVLENVLKLIRSKRDVLKTSGLKKWLAMKLKINGCFNASLCQTSWETSLGCPAGDYEYIDVIMKSEDCETIRLIIDIDFKSQFELARPTQSYKELTDALPSIFVGTEEKLNKIISFLCSAAKQSLREAGLHVPPWRTTNYMQSKWFSGCQKTTAGSYGGFIRENRQVKAKAIAKVGGAHSFSKWAPPMVKPKRRDLSGGGGSALSSQISNMDINCC